MKKTMLEIAINECNTNDIGLFIAAYLSEFIGKRARIVIEDAEEKRSSKEGE